ncbi:biotin-dependent carboxyltransferase family protein [Parasalinivibrio latis]|uniref:5-oxoprolinase subunit C family protein n=1 Tax=Parasalinivibrio latis TaxID=2952610 RepID=UPI0030DDE2A7
MFGLEVINPGLFTLIQDPGRFGVGHLGLSSGGPVDLHAFCWANKLLGNKADAACLEIMMGNASFRAMTDITVALTGADTQPRIDGYPQPHWRAFNLKQGQTLQLGFAQSGLRAYLAVAGGIQAPDFLGSKATVVRNGLGGLPVLGEKLGTGNKIQAGDKIPVRHKCKKTHLYSVPKTYIPDYPDTLSVGVIPSYQFDSFSSSSVEQFFNSEYEITQQSDRMGIRLSGPAIKSKLKGIISEGIAPGSIQIPADGQPIVLMNDRQTLGGYPKIGCVTRLAQSKLAQAKPGTTVRFQQAIMKGESIKLSAFLRFFNL